MKNFVDEINQKDLALTMRTIMKWLHKNNRYQYGDGSSVLAYPEEHVPRNIAKIVEQQLSTFNLNIVSSYYYEGYLRLLRECAFNVSHNFFHLEKKYYNSFGVSILPNTTNSIKQALIASAQYGYRKKTGRDLRSDGLIKATENSFYPVVVAPITAKFLIDRSAPYLGWGDHSCCYYDINSHYQPDTSSLQKLLKKLRSENKTVVATLLFGGDATHGIFQKNVKEVSGSFKKFAYEPIIIIDSCSQWLVSAAMKTSHYFDFMNPEVDMLIIDPQKVGFPHFNSWLLMRDSTIFNSFYTDDHGFSPSLDILRNSIMTSRGIAGDFSFVAHTLMYGTQSLLKKGKEDYLNAQKLRSLILKSKYLTLYPCDGRIISFGVNRKYKVSNWQLAQALNNGTTSVGTVTVGYDAAQRATKVEDYQRAENGSAYDGLFGTVNGLHNYKNIFLLINKIERAVEELENTYET